MKQANDLIDRLEDILPQTQCTKCGYPDCRGYAEALATGSVAPNRCPPGGVEGIVRLSQILTPIYPQDAFELHPRIDPDCGVERPRPVALIDPQKCIGCTLCIQGDSARVTPMAGLIEVKVGNQIIYTDANGEYVIEGQLLETKSQRNLTEERMDEINKVDFANLPFKDAIVWKNGNGKRRLVIFADPNCGYCKHLERDIQQIKDVTVYTFMIAILGEDSRAKLDNIWCVKDRTLAWRDWMLNGSAPAKAFGMCASPAQRNLALSQKLRVNGTPAMFFEDGSRLASAASAAVVEQRLSKASAKIGG